MRRVLIAAGLVPAGLLLGACGTTSDGPAATDGPPAAVQDDFAAQQRKAENMIADCMKQKGFRYVPSTTSTVSRADQYIGPPSLLQADDVVRPLRQKYGFGVAAKEVYPNDPLVNEPNASARENPNNKIREDLDEAQRQAYDKAMGTGGKPGVAGTPGCVEQASKAVFGITDINRAEADAERAWEKFGSDPAVVAAAQKYADCLRSKGYRISRGEPGEVETFVLEQVRPASAVAVGEEDTSTAGDPRTALKAEIGKALDDLDCRGPYADIVRTRYPSIVHLSRGQG
ncbi:hypothetical protein Asp14428_13290 [Actinoplanes sp. NBRC 14428]|nr:hypothetical protein Asp14428_13290 [Actinoplanes sp. NBRC 14428]